MPLPARGRLGEVLPYSLAMPVPHTAQDTCTYIHMYIVCGVISVPRISLTISVPHSAQYTRGISSYDVHSTGLCSYDIRNGRFEVVGCPSGMLSPYTFDTRCPILTAISLRARYAMSGTDIACGAISLRACYAMRGTEMQTLWYQAIVWSLQYKRSCTRLRGTASVIFLSDTRY
eukprot:125660-Rhodomonas_salina.2